MIGFTVIGGYLGAGKTTLLNQLLRQNDGRRIALLINDFGDINVDAGLIESASESQLNLTNGCVCCTLSDGFSEAIEQLASLDPEPDHIVVEASGVANVSSLAQYGYGHNMALDAVVVVADAETVIRRANDKYVAQTVQRQLAAADLIVLNKLDLVPDDRQRQVLDWLGANYPGIPVVLAVRGEVPLDVLLGHHARGQARDIAAGHDHYSALDLQITGPVSRRALDGFLAALPDAVLRAKGVIAVEDNERVLVQVVGQRREIDPYAGDLPVGRLVLIGPQARFDEAAVRALADHWLH